jgi:hypothetical protein
LENRKTPRYPVTWPATLRVATDAYVRAEARDVTEGGIGLVLLEKPAFFPSNVMVMLGTAIGPILGHGKLRWEKPGSSLRAGLVFTPHAGFSCVRFELALATLARGERVPPQAMVENVEDR